VADTGGARRAPAEPVNDTGKWLLSIGIHRGTLTSRDSDQTRHDSEPAARQAYRTAKDYYTSTGTQIWYANMLPPGAPYSTGWIILDHGVPYAR
jgi:hypothetical protein